MSEKVATIVTVEEVRRAQAVARVGAERTDQLIAALKALDENALDEPSQLPGWTRLTIVCHLRYGAHAMLRMTRDTLAGRATAYYPSGRAHQRPGTLRPAPGEHPADVLQNWESASRELDDEWSAVTDGEWSTRVIEPVDNPDLGTVPLARLALARLTEVDVHAIDLGIGAPDWSPMLVEVGLPTRLALLSSRRTNHRAFDRSVRGSWLLRATDGPRWLVAVDGAHVASRPAAPRDAATATIEGSSRDLLALLLGRPRRAPLNFSGDEAFARSFELAFPGP